MATAKGSKPVLSLEAFLHNLLCEPEGYRYSSPTLTHVPPWASSCPHLFYTNKSIPLIFPESNQLYICYEDKPSAIGLIGEGQNKKRINRTLNVEAKGSTVIVRSKHKDHETNHYVTFEGRGSNFENAISDYFAKSDLKSCDYKFTMNNVQKEGDAFILQMAADKEKHSSRIIQIAQTVKNIFKLVPEEKHDDLIATIEIKIKSVKDLMHLQEIRDIANHYDTRLWVIVESLCNHFDPDDIDPKRKAHRNHLIAECCSNLVKGIDIFPHLESYFEVLKMHRVIIQAFDKNNLDDQLKELVHSYKKFEFAPEIIQHREKIKEFFTKYSAVAL